MTDLTSLTLAEASARLAQKDVSSAELTQAHIDAIDAAETLNAFRVHTPELALNAAKASDKKRAKRKTPAPALEGIPLGVKDLFCVEGMPTAACSKILERFVPPYESTVTAKLKKNGAVFLGKTSMDEFAMGSSNETAVCGPVINPWRAEGGNVNLVPGGSSGGSAAAVAAGLCLGATGTDTGGSIRQPAAFTGITGVKPTYGLCSRWGIIAFASSLDQAGPMARTVTDCAIMLEAMAGHDPMDSTSLKVDIPRYAEACGQSVKGLRVGIPAEYRIDGMPGEIDALWDQGAAWLKDAGCELVEVSLPHTKYALPTYYIIAPAEASSNLARYDGMRYGARVEGSDLTDTYEQSRAAGFGQEVQRRILIGAHVLSAGYYDAYYLRAQKVRRKIRDDFDAAFHACDAILTPTTPGAAFAFGAKSDDPVEMYLNDIMTVTANLAGLPAASVPAGLSNDGLPLGLQLISPALDEYRMFSLAAALERAADFTAKPRAWWGG